MSDDDDIASIAPYVIQVLTRSRFFDVLDHRLCPESLTPEDAAPRAKCGRDFAISKSLLDQIGFPEQDQADIFAVLQDRGARCDCEILYNVVVKSRLKDEYVHSHPGVEGRRFAHGSAIT